MAEKSRKTGTKPEKPNRFPDQDEYGNDLAHIRANLRLTPTERVERMAAFMTLFLEARRAGKSCGLQDSPRGY